MNGILVSGVHQHTTLANSIRWAAKDAGVGVDFMSDECSLHAGDYLVELEDSHFLLVMSVSVSGRNLTEGLYDTAEGIAENAGPLLTVLFLVSSEFTPEHPDETVRIRLLNVSKAFWSKEIQDAHQAAMQAV
jgi:hypothetical protein